MKSARSKDQANGRGNKSAEVSAIPGVGFGLNHGKEGDAGAPADQAVSQPQEMLAIAAYFLAERRGFAPGGELDDWLAAEAQIRALHQP